MRVASKSGSSNVADTTADASGKSFVSNFNKWDNTAFYKLCLGKSSSDLSRLLQCEDLNFDKRRIAVRVQEQISGDSSGNYV